MQNSGVKATKWYLDGPKDADIMASSCMYIALHVSSLDGRNRAIVIVEALTRVIAAIRIASIRWRSYVPLKT